jgi:hypothetical protein
MNKVEAIRGRHGIRKDLNVISILSGPATAVVEDAFRVGEGVSDKTQVLDTVSGEWQTLNGRKGRSKD